MVGDARLASSRAMIRVWASGPVLSDADTPCNTVTPCDPVTPYDSRSSVGAAGLCSRCGPVSVAVRSGAFAEVASGSADVVALEADVATASGDVAEDIFCRRRIIRSHRSCCPQTGPVEAKCMGLLTEIMVNNVEMMHGCMVNNVEMMQS